MPNKVAIVHPYEDDLSVVRAFSIPDEAAHESFKKALLAFNTAEDDFFKRLDVADGDPPEFTGFMEEHGFACLETETYSLDALR